MAANAVIRVLDLKSTWTALSGVPLVCDVTLLVPGKNSEPAELLGDDQESVPLDQGTTVALRGVDLSTLRAKGKDGDQLVMIGATR